MKVSDISFAAFLRLRGCELTEVEPRGFVFDKLSPETIRDYTLEYHNSECRLHDIEVCGLRDLQRAARSRTK